MSRASAQLPNVFPYQYILIYKILTRAGILHETKIYMKNDPVFVGTFLSLAKQFTPWSFTSSNPLVKEYSSPGVWANRDTDFNWSHESASAFVCVHNPWIEFHFCMESTINLTLMQNRLPTWPSQTLLTLKWDSCSDWFWIAHLNNHRPYFLRRDCRRSSMLIASIGCI